MSQVYETIDLIINTLGAETLAEYIYVNYPEVAEAMMAKIHSLVMLEELKDINDGS
jgi:hypothetical protein